MDILTAVEVPRKIEQASEGEIQDAQQIIERFGAMKRSHRLQQAPALTSLTDWEELLEKISGNYHLVRGPVNNNILMTVKSETPEPGVNVKEIVYDFREPFHREIILRHITIPDEGLSMYRVMELQYDGEIPRVMCVGFIGFSDAVDKYCVGIQDAQEKAHWLLERDGREAQELYETNAEAAENTDRVEHKKEQILRTFTVSGMYGIDIAEVLQRVKGYNTEIAELQKKE